MTTTTERTLERRIEELEEENDEKRREIEKLEQQLIGCEHGWHYAGPAELREDLPCPRLEMVFLDTSREPGAWASMEWVYRLVYRHLLGHLERVNLGHTTSRGSRRPPPNPSDLPFRDGVHLAHDSVFLGLPAFSIIDGEATDLGSHIAEKYQHAVQTAREHRETGKAT